MNYYVVAIRFVEMEHRFRRSVYSGHEGMRILQEDVNEGATIVWQGRASDAQTAYEAAQ